MLLQISKKLYWSLLFYINFHIQTFTSNKYTMPEKQNYNSHKCFKGVPEYLFDYLLVLKALTIYNALDRSTHFPKSDG